MKNSTFHNKINRGLVFSKRVETPAPAKGTAKEKNCVVKAKQRPADKVEKLSRKVALSFFKKNSDNKAAIPQRKLLEARVGRGMDKKHTPPMLDVIAAAATHKKPEMLLCFMEPPPVPV